MTENSRTTTKQNPACRREKTGAYLLLFLAAAVLSTVLLSGAAGAAGTITVDTSGIVGLAGDTALIPVTVSGAEGIHAWQLDVDITDDETAKIIPNTASVRKARATSNGKTVYWYTTSSDPSDFIKGEQTLFYIAVTPRTTGEIPVNISRVKIFENNANTQTPYEVVNGNLAVTGQGTGLTYGDSDSGATVRIGTTDTAGSFTTGDATGVRAVTVPSASDETVIDYTDSTGLYDIPDGVEYAEANEVYLYNTWKTGDKYAVAMGVKESELTDAGITSDKAIIIHPIEKYDKNNNLIGVKWYKVPIQSVETTEDGIVEYTFDTWSNGPFLLVTDDGGNKFDTETAKTAIGGDGFELSPMMIAAIGGAALILIIIIVIIVIVRHRRG